MPNILRIALKDLKLLLRDRAALFWVLGWPLVFAFFFGTIMGGSGSGPSQGMEVALVDQDQSEVSRRLVEHLHESDAVRIEELPLSKARDRVRRGEEIAYILLEPGYGEQLGPFGPAQRPIHVGIDPSRKAESAYLQGVLAKASFAMIQDQMADRDAMQEQIARAQGSLEKEADPAKQQGALIDLLGSLQRYYDASGSEAGGGGIEMNGPEIEMESVVRERAGRPRSAFEISFPSAILWALIACAASFAVSMVLERQEGTLLRLRTSPVSRLRILAGKGLACFLASTGVISVLLLLAMAFFGVHVGSPPILLVGMFCTAICFTGLMMMMSVLGKTPRAVSGIGWATMLVFAMFGGGMIPLIAMPSWMQSASNSSPHKWAILALEGGIWRDFSATDMMLPCGILLGIGLVTFTIGVSVFSVSES